jgi:hypothetical protein
VRVFATFVFFAILVTLTATSGLATTYTLTQTPSVTMGSYSWSSSLTHYEEFWDFSAQPGWSPGSMDINSVQFTYSFANYASPDEFRSTILNYADAQAVSVVPTWGQPGYGSAARAGTLNDWFDVGSIFVIFGNTVGGGTGPSATYTPGVGGFQDSMVLNDGGKFWTRLGRNNGSFTFSSMTVTIDADNTSIPEPATFVLLGSAVLALGLLRRMRV